MKKILQVLTLFFYFQSAHRLSQARQSGRFTLRNMRGKAHIAVMNRWIKKIGLMLLVVSVFGQSFATSAHQDEMMDGPGRSVMMLAASVDNGMDANCTMPCGDEHATCADCCQNMTCLTCAIIPNPIDIRAFLTPVANHAGTENFPEGIQPTFRLPPPTA